MWPPRVQIGGVSSLKEALFCHRVGVDAVGFTLELPSGPHDGLSRDLAASIIAALPPGVLPVVITYLSSSSDAVRLVNQVSAGAIQFHGGISPKEIMRFRTACPHVRTIGCVTVMDESAIGTARTFESPLWDAIILDSYDAESGKRGATGKAHDWSISARIVQSAAVPVILAGGLNPDNVAEAVRIVRPHGVDAHTGLENSAGKRDFAKIERFVRTALDSLGRLAVAGTE